MHVVATAGHVDHGKSTLVRALTGMEPDRFAEERRRGLTIDLGYAWTSLPSGRRLAFVDVPGHERFIGNMLAGIGPAPAVLFVVAADAGWAPQSEEHLAAVDALNVRHGLLAVTRADLADPGPALADARHRLARSTLGEVPAVAVSPVTGAGLADLATALDALVDALPAPDVAAPVRLWLDRSFTVRGSGTVVTGTLSAGRVAVGDTLHLPGGRDVTVREVQSAEASVPGADAVARVALNLRGIARQEIGRGDVLLTPDAWHVTDAVDVELLAARQAPAELVLHVGTAALPVRVRPLGDRYARLALPRPLPLRAGDRAVLRDPGRHAIAAGVLVMDADPPPLRRRGAAAARAVALDALHAVDRADDRAVLAAEVRRRGAVRGDRLRRLGVPLTGAAELPGAGDWLVSPETWQRWIAALPRQLESWQRRHPLEPAAPVAAIRREVQLPDDELLVAVAAAAGLTISGGRIAASGTGARTFGPAEAGLRVVADTLAAEPFRAPERHELAELRLGRRELAAAARDGRLLRLDDDVVLLPDAPHRAAELLRALPQPFTTSEARQALTSTRRVVVPLLEYLDRLGVTERVDAAHRRIRN
jgi:selenocysteine-specific elongation factor